MGRRPARYTERTTDNVMDSLRAGFGNETAFEYGSAVQVVIRDFACQRTTAAKLIREAIDAGSLLVMSFLDGGALWRVTNRATGDVTETNDFPRFVCGDYPGYFSRGLVHTNRIPRGKNVPDEGDTGLAFPDVFAAWHAGHLVRVAEDQAQRAQDHQDHVNATRIAHPALAPLDDLSNAWKGRADANGKLSPVDVHIYQSDSGSPFVSIHLRGKRVDKAAADLLAVLEKHFPLG